jgi:hypothetical protein
MLTWLVNLLRYFLEIRPVTKHDQYVSLESLRKRGHR